MKNTKITEEYENWKNTILSEEKRRFNCDEVPYDIYGWLEEEYFDEDCFDYVPHFSLGSREISEQLLDWIINKQSWIQKEETNTTKPKQKRPVQISLFEQINPMEVA